MYDIEKLGKKHLSCINDNALFLPDMRQTEKDLSQWNLVFADIFLSHCIKKEKKDHESSNDDVINFKSMIENTHSVLFYKYYGLSLKNLVFWDLSCC